MSRSSNSSLLLTSLKEMGRRRDGWSREDGRAGFSRGMSDGRRSEEPRSLAISISAIALILSGRGVSCARDMEVTVLHVRKP